jgi:hypothetical protein
MRHDRNAAALMLGLSALSLAGCASTGAGSGPDLGSPQLIAPERSIVRLPEELAQARLAVRRQVEGGLWLERVVLDNNTAVSRENAIVVQTGRATNPHTETSINRRLNLEFEDWQKVSPPLDRVNARGPHRYIEAADKEVQCVLAWQMIDAVASVTGGVRSYALDFRFCDTRRDAEALLALFDQLELQPSL